MKKKAKRKKQEKRQELLKAIKYELISASNRLIDVEELFDELRESYEHTKKINL